MNNETKKYRNYIKTEKAIKTALIKLYKEKRNINKITVKELCEVANISRSTFYLHYNDLISIFESVGDVFVESLKEMITDITKVNNLNFKPYLTTLFNLINESNELIKIGLSSEFPLVYIDRIKTELETIILNNKTITYTKVNKTQILTEIRIVVAGLISLIIDLIKKHDKIDVIKYTNILNDFLIRWTNTLI